MHKVRLTKEKCPWFMTHDKNMNFQGGQQQCTLNVHERNQQEVAKLRKRQAQHIKIT